MIQKCYMICVQSYMEKPLSPKEKECMATCLENIHGLKIEFEKNFKDSW